LYNSDAALNANTVTANTAIWYGGGLYLNDSDAELTNNIIADNQASRGSGLYLFAQSSPNLRHTTIARNSGGDGSGVYVTGDSSVALFNTILVKHIVGINVTEYSAATLNATLWGSGTWANDTDWDGDGDIIVGTPNYWDSPAFVAPDAGNYHIGPGSAAIDAGVNAGITTDIDGDPRPIGAGFDIGADEYVSTPTPTPAAAIYLPVVLKSYSP